MASSKEMKRILLDNIYRLSGSKINTMVQTDKLIQACKDIYTNAEDIYSDISYFEDKGLIKSIKADNAPVLAVKITSYGVDEIENIKLEEEQSKHLSDIFTKLSYFNNEKDKLIGGDINSEQGHKWLANISALIGKVDAMKQADFDALSYKVILPLSDITRIPIWENMLLIIQQIIAGLESTKNNNSERIYPAGSNYDLYHDIREIIQSSKNSVMIVDPYADEEIFDLYVAKLINNIDIKLLIKQPSAVFVKVIEKFSKQYGPHFKCSYSIEIHDRLIIVDQSECYVLGQSIKDAANKKATYLTKIYSIEMIKLYDDIWKRGTSIC